MKRRSGCLLTDPYRKCVLDTTSINTSQGPTQFISTLGGWIQFTYLKIKVSSRKMNYRRHTVTDVARVL